MEDKMKAHKYDEQVQTYYMTCNLPIRVYNNYMDILSEAGTTDCPSKFNASDYYDEIKKSNNYYEHTTIYNEKYIAIPTKHLIILVGPFLIELPTYSFSYLKDLPIIKKDSLNYHYKYLILLFSELNHSQHKNNNSFDSILMEYRGIDFYHHDYLLETQYRHHRFKGRMSQSDDQKFRNIEPAIISDDYIRSYKNIAIVNIAVIGRYTIEHGVDVHYSFSIGDAYIRKLENLTNLADITQLMDEAFEAYKNVLDTERTKRYSIKIRKAVHYIDKNLSIGFTIEDVAQHVRLHPNYLSTLFKKEVGMSYTDYITKEKIEEAKILLKFSNNTLAEISGMLNFCSKSYFLKCFKKVVGMTTAKYMNHSK